MEGHRGLMGRLLLLMDGCLLDMSDCKLDDIDRQDLALKDYVSSISQVGEPHEEVQSAPSRHGRRRPVGRDDSGYGGRRLDGLCRW